MGYFYCIRQRCASEHHYDVCRRVCVGRNHSSNLEEVEAVPVEKKSTQAAATRRYEQKVGLISKSYKLRKELVEEYAAACAKEGVSASGQLSKMMKAFIEKANERHPD